MILSTRIRRNTKSLGVLLVFCVGIIGCTKDARLYDMSSGKVAALKYITTGHGKGRMSGMLPSGEVLTGEYVAVTNVEAGWGSIYASVYGPNGNAAANGNAIAIKGSGRGEGTAILTGNEGAVINCEFIFSTWSGHGAGACKDNHENKYKLMF